jgi:hypothetical protein
MPAGASAVQRLLEKYPSAKLQVLVVWEPILGTDWRPPSQSTLGRISDRRARQFYDADHRVSQELSRVVNAKAAQPEPDCCVDKGFYWDDAILYGPGAHWKDAPAPVFWNGPVAPVIRDLEKALGNLGGENGGVRSAEMPLSDCGGGRKRPCERLNGLRRFFEIIFGG